MSKLVVDLYTSKGRKSNLGGLIAGMFAGLFFLILGIFLFIVIKEIEKKVFAVIMAFIGGYVFILSIISLFKSLKRSKVIDRLIKNGNCTEADIIGIKNGYANRLVCSYVDSIGQKKEVISDDVHVYIQDVLEKLKISQIPIYFDNNDYFIDVRVLYDSVVDLT